MHMDEMVKNLAEINVSGVPLPLLDFKFDSERLDFIRAQINQFDFVMISSPSAIEFVAEAIALADKPKFITVGAASAKRIRNYTKQEIIYPELSSGQEALFNEKLRHLDLINKKVLVIKGDIENDESYVKLAKSHVNWTIVDIYSRIFLPIESEKLKKLLEDNELRGIIITTSTLVGWLFKEADRAGYGDLLKSRLFIALHPQIEKKLLNCGAGRILLTQSANRTAVTGLIRSLHG